MRLGLTIQRRRHALAYQPLPNPGDRIEMHRKRLGNPGVGPVRPVRIRFEQDLRMADFRRRRLTFAHQRRQLLTLFRRQAHNIFFGHGSPRSGWLAEQLNGSFGP